jgi:aspartate aminotransferase
MFFTILALCQPADEVLHPDPGFPMYPSIAAFAGARPVPVPLREANRFRMDPGELASLVTDRTRLVILNSPHNPCGSGLTTQDVEAIAAVALEHDLVVLSDEVYWAIRYGGGHPSVLSVDGMAERTVLLDGWSKTFAMTGWRLGFGVLPAALVEPVTRLVVNSVSCTAAFSRAGCCIMTYERNDGSMRVLSQALHPKSSSRADRGCDRATTRGHAGACQASRLDSRGAVRRRRRQRVPGQAPR